MLNEADKKMAPQVGLEPANPPVNRLQGSQNRQDEQAAIDLEAPAEVASAHNLTRGL